MDSDHPSADRQSGSLTNVVIADLQRALNQPLAGGLYIVATPIGNLGDITLRALAVLARAGRIYCEDTRHSRRLLDHFDIAAPTRPYHEHNAHTERPRILRELADGAAIALISDAGTPLVSDPGYKLVRDVIAAGHRVWSLPGPSAVMTAVTIAGLPTDAFFFAGFLPPRSAARRTRIRHLSDVPGTLVFFEAPSRLAAALDDLSLELGDRPAAVARELTKLYEEVMRGTLAELAQWAAATPSKGEMVILVGQPLDRDVTDADILVRLEAALDGHSLRDAAKLVAEALDVSKRRVYDLGLAMLGEEDLST